MLRLLQMSVSGLFPRRMHAGLLEAAASTIEFCCATHAISARLGTWSRLPQILLTIANFSDFYFRIFTGANACSLLQLERLGFLISQILTHQLRKLNHETFAVPLRASAKLAMWSAVWTPRRSERDHRRRGDLYDASNIREFPS